MTKSIVVLFLAGLTVPVCQSKALNCKSILKISDDVLKLQQIGVAWESCSANAGWVRKAEQAVERSVDAEKSSDELLAYAELLAGTQFQRRVQAAAAGALLAECKSVPVQTAVLEAQLRKLNDHAALFAGASLSKGFRSEQNWLQHELLNTTNNNADQMRRLYALFTVPQVRQQVDRRLAYFGRTCAAIDNAAEQASCLANQRAAGELSGLQNRSWRDLLGYQSIFSGTSSWFDYQALLQGALARCLENCAPQELAQACPYMAEDDRRACQNRPQTAEAPPQEADRQDVAPVQQAPETEPESLEWLANVRRKLDLWTAQEPQRNQPTISKQVLQLWWTLFDKTAYDRHGRSLESLAPDVVADLNAAYQRVQSESQSAARNAGERWSELRTRIDLKLNGEPQWRAFRDQWRREFEEIRKLADHATVLDSDQKWPNQVRDEMSAMKQRIEQADQSGQTHFRDPAKPAPSFCTVVIDPLLKAAIAFVPDPLDKFVATFLLNAVTNVSPICEWF
jgi:hypothetical protein